MKILWLRPSKGDNISIRRERIAAYLTERGFEVTIRDASWWDAPGAILETLTGDYDIVAANVRMGLFIGYPVARLRRLPVLGDVSDPISDIDYIPEPFRSVFEWLEWQFLDRVDAAVFVYESTFAEAKARGVDGVRLPNAVDFEAFEHPDQAIVEEAQTVLSDAGVDLTRPMAIYIGGFSHSYCILEILEAAKRVPDWEFVFIGEGKLEHEVENAATSLENVHYPGAFRYALMPGFLAFASAGFCFKDAEQPLKLKEYAAAGLPVIVRPGVLSTWYEPDELVFTEPTPSDIASTLGRLEDEEVNNAYGQAIREAIDRRSWADIAQEYQRIFEAITE